MRNKSVARMEMKRFRQSVKARIKFSGAVDLLTDEME
jgi:hypothetical protein